jgi:hypothetical protein
MTSIDMTKLAAIVAQSVAEALAAQTKPQQPSPSANGAAQPKIGKAERLAAKDASLVRGFVRKGFKDVVLMDRNDPSKPFNVRPFKAWLEQGRLVRKGERSIRGLFAPDDPNMIAGWREAQRRKARGE